MDLMKIKEKIHRSLYPIAPNIDPNLITFISIFITFLAVYLFLHQKYLTSALVFILSQILDILDGTVAEKYDRKSKFGAAFDRVVDRINDSQAVIALTIASKKYIFGLILLASMIIASYMSSVYESFTKTKKGEGVSKRWLRVLIISIGFALNKPYETMLVLSIIVAKQLIDRFILLYSLKQSP